jgi:hypothetical protein
MEINLKNVEEIIFFDKKMPEILPEFRHFLDQWRLGKTIPALGGLGTKSVLDLLNSLQTEHIKRLEDYFGTSVFVDKLEPSIVKNHSIKVDDTLCGFTQFKSFCVSRNSKDLLLTFWR